MRANLDKNQPTKDNHLAMEAATSIGGFLKNITASIPVFNRSILVVVVEVGEPEVNRIRSELEKRSFCTYNNVTLVNDCATMIRRAVEPDASPFIAVVDVGPTMMANYYAMRKTLGDGRIKKIIQVTHEPNGLHQTYLVRNSFISYLEIVVREKFLLLDMPERIKLDFENTIKGRPYEWYDADVLKKFKTDYRDYAISRKRYNADIDRFLKDAMYVRQGPENEKKKLQLEFDQIIGSRIRDLEKVTVNRDVIDFTEHMLNHIEYTYLLESQEKFIAILGR